MNAVVLKLLLNYMLLRSAADDDDGLKITTMNGPQRL